MRCCPWSIESIGAKLDFRVWLIQWPMWNNRLILYYNEANFHTYAISYIGKFYSPLAIINKSDPWIGWCASVFKKKLMYETTAEEVTNMSTKVQNWKIKLFIMQVSSWWIIITFRAKPSCRNPWGKLFWPITTILQYMAKVDNYKYFLNEMLSVNIHNLAV
jgi:hypothetical protein